MSISETERRTLAALICILSAPSITVWFVRVVPDAMATDLFRPDRGWRLARAALWVAAVTVWFTPIFFGISVWALRRIWPSISGATRACLTVCVVSPGSLLIFTLLELLFFLTFDFS